MKESIKNLRIQIDGLAQLTKELKPIKTIEKPKEPVNNRFTSNEIYIEVNSKEIEKAVDSLYLAKAWLGKVLGELGTENPYGSGYKTVEDIVPTQDVALHGGGVIYSVGFNYIEKVDWLRTEIEKIIKNLPKYRDFDNSIKDENKTISLPAIYQSILQHLCEARFWLGWELNRLRDEK